MVNHVWKKGLLVSAFALAGALAIGCSSDTKDAVTLPEPKTVQSTVATTAPEPVLVGALAEGIGSEIVEDDGGAAASDVDNGVFADGLGQIEVAGLSDSEAAGIIYMREEEKLARDVYLTLQEKWGLSIFGNIARSEETHMGAVKTLIDRYDLVDPAEGKAIGEFSNLELQSLYDELVEKGSQSLLSALEVGAAIEEIDIIDLEQYFTQTDEKDIQSVYENLLQGSENHLRSFASQYERNGGTYKPQYLSQAEYDEIINATMADKQTGSGGYGASQTGNDRSGTGAPGSGKRGVGRNASGTQGGRP